MRIALCNAEQGNNSGISGWRIRLFIRILHSDSPVLIMLGGLSGIEFDIGNRLFTSHTLSLVREARECLKWRDDNPYSNTRGEKGRQVTTAGHIIHREKCSPADHNRKSPDKAVMKGRRLDAGRERREIEEGGEDGGRQREKWCEDGTWWCNGAILYLALDRKRTFGW